MKNELKAPPRTSFTLRDLLKEREKVDEAIGKALAREYPVGALVHWAHGRHEIAGRVTEHWGTRLRARNTNTGNYKDLEASEVVWYEDRP